MEELKRLKADNKYYVIATMPKYVRNVASVVDACNIAVAEVGKLVPGYVSVDVGSIICPSCGNVSKAVLLVAGDALVGVTLGLKVFADTTAGAERVARRVLGDRIKAPLRILSVEEI